MIESIEVRPVTLTMGGSSFGNSAAESSCGSMQLHGLHAAPPFGILEGAQYGTVPHLR